jgi:hypothetical protein
MEGGMRDGCAGREEFGFWLLGLWLLALASRDVLAGAGARSPSLSQRLELGASWGGPLGGGLVKDNRAAPLKREPCPSAHTRLPSSTS